MAAAMLLAGCAATPSTPEGEIAADFVRLAAPADAETGPARVRKWMAPIRYASLGASTPLAKASLDLMMRQVGNVTGHDIARAVEGEPNYLVIFSATDAADALARYAGAARSLLTEAETPRSVGARCWFHTAIAEPQSTLVSAVIVVPAAPPGEAQRCIAALAAQSMGFLNAGTGGARLSAMEVGAPYEFLTARDKLLLRVLYDERMTPGLASSEAERVARSVLEGAATGSLQGLPAPSRQR